MLLDVLKIIEKKRDKAELNDEEISFFVKEAVEGDICDYQISAFLMAVFINGMTDSEISSLTKAMADSGDKLDLSCIDGIKVDKHSSGGVGDKTTLVVAPMVAACGLAVAKMSGRGLGFSGGTIDKLESIPNFRVSLTEEEFTEFVKRDKIALMSQTKNVAPADKKFYAIRDVTATVESIPLIAASIMSKKLACNSDAIVLDVKCGSGAFMKDFDSALELARQMELIGRNNGREVTALITNMEHPLGKAVGNALEVKEAVDVLKGGGDPDFVELCMIIGSFMLMAGKIAGNLTSSRRLLENSIKSGAALEKFRKFISNQGGDPEITEDFSLLPQAKYVCELNSPVSGVISSINGKIVGEASLEVKAGRKHKSDNIDFSSGFVFLKKVGETVVKGEPLIQIHAGGEIDADNAAKQLVKAYSFGEKYEKKPVLLAYVDKGGVHYDKKAIE